MSPNVCEYPVNVKFGQFLGWPSLTAHFTIGKQSKSFPEKL